MDKWNFFPSLEGDALILGPGFDYEAMISVSKENGMLIIKAPYPSHESDVTYPYPNMLELCVPLDQIKDLLDKAK